MLSTTGSACQQKNAPTEQQIVDAGVVKENAVYVGKRRRQNARGFVLWLSTACESEAGSVLPELCL